MFDISVDLPSEREKFYSQTLVMSRVYNNIIILLVMYITEH